LNTLTVNISSSTAGGSDYSEVYPQILLKGETVVTYNLDALAVGYEVIKTELNTGLGFALQNEKKLGEKVLVPDIVSYNTDNLLRLNTLQPMKVKYDGYFTSYYSYITAVCGILHSNLAVGTIYIPFKIAQNSIYDISKDLKLIKSQILPTSGSDVVVIYESTNPLSGSNIYLGVLNSNKLVSTSEYDQYQSSTHTLKSVVDQSTGETKYVVVEDQILPSIDHGVLPTDEDEISNIGGADVEYPNKDPFILPTKEKVTTTISDSSDSKSTTPDIIVDRSLRSSRRDRVDIPKTDGKDSITYYSIPKYISTEITGTPTSTTNYTTTNTSLSSDDIYPVEVIVNVPGTVLITGLFGSDTDIIDILNPIPGLPYIPAPVSDCSKFPVSRGIVPLSGYEDDIIEYTTYTPPSADTTTPSLSGDETGGGTGGSGDTDPLPPVVDPGGSGGGSGGGTLSGDSIPEGWFVSPTGTALAAGTYEDPWEFTYALTNTGQISPGQTLWFKEGTYKNYGTGVYYDIRSDYQVTLAGTSGNKIYIKPLSGAHAIIDGNFYLTGTANELFIEKFHFQLSEPVPVSPSLPGSAPSDIQDWGYVGIYCDAGDEHYIINNIIHDGAQGMSIWDGADTVVCYGNIIYDNGWVGTDRAHGHGIYTQNTFPGTKTYRHNLIESGLTRSVGGTAAFHAFGTAPIIEGMNLHNNGIKGDTIVYSQNQHSNAISVSGNYFMGGLVPGLGFCSIIIGRAYRPDENVLFVDNTGINIRRYVYSLGWDSVTQSGNRFYDIDTNWAYWFSLPYHDPTTGLELAAGSYEYDEIEGNHIDLRYTTGTDEYAFWENEYDSNRAHLVIMDLNKDNEVTVDLSSWISIGQTLTIRHFKDYYGTPTLTNTYTGGTIDVPIVESGDRMDMFVVQKS
jgi:hypothetical protein